MIIKPEIFQNNLIKSMQTTRFGGFSVQPYDGMNLGCFGDDPAVEKNITLLHQQQQLPHRPVFLKQVHGDTVVEYNQVPEKHGAVSADGCFTRKKRIICAVLTADCLPVLLADKAGTMVAALHCGWRGLYANIIEKAINQFGQDSSQLSCWLGPCISYQPYRVDEVFREKFVNRHPQLSDCFYQNKKTGWHADLKKIAIKQLQSQGVVDCAQSPYCTHDNRSLFYSYRRDTETGRMASLIWLDD